MRSESEMRALVMIAAECDSFGHPDTANYIRERGKLPEDMRMQASRVVRLIADALASQGEQQVAGDATAILARHMRAVAAKHGVPNLAADADTVEDGEEWDFWIEAAHAAVSEALAARQPVEMSPEFTDTARGAIAWVLWHHQGGSSAIGQPLRYALGMGAHDELGEARIAEAKRYAAWAGATTADFHRPPVQPQAPAAAVPEDTWRLDWLSNLVESACVTSCFELDGGIHLTIDEPSKESVAFRDRNNLREAIDAAMAAAAPAPGVSNG